MLLVLKEKKKERKDKMWLRTLQILWKTNYTYIKMEFRKFSNNQHEGKKRETKYWETEETHKK
jgi:hypothetical protein